jgi:hypothetical protein
MTWQLVTIWSFATTTPDPTPRPPSLVATFTLTIDAFILNNNSGVGAVDRTSILGALLREHEESNPPIKSNNRKLKKRFRIKSSKLKSEVAIESKLLP